MEEAAEFSELAHRIGEQLGRFGVAGRVVTDGRDVVLLGHGPRVRLDVSGEIEGFRSSAESERRQIVERLARELSARRRALAPSIAPKSRRFLEWLRIIPGVVAVFGGTYAAWFWLGKPAQKAVAHLAHSNAKSDNSARLLAQQAASAALHASPSTESPLARCKAVRARIATGGSVSLLDVDGWVVELMLLSPAPGLGPDGESIRSFLQKDEQGAYRVVWADEPTLRLRENTGTLVHLGAEPLASVLPNTRSGIRLSFMGKYVPFFFDEAERLKFTRFSSALYEASGANYGALYARCSDGGSHHLGAWFRGSDFAAASLSLVASMGLYAEQPHLAGVGLSGDPLEQRRALSSYQDRTKKLNRERLTLLLADDGGMLAARPGQWAAITFPFSDGNRASRASLKLALAAGVGPARH